MVSTIVKDISGWASNRSTVGWPPLGAPSCHIDIHRQSLTFPKNTMSLSLPPKWPRLLPLNVTFFSSEKLLVLLRQQSVNFDPMAKHLYIHIFIQSSYNDNYQPYESHPRHPQTPENAYEWPKGMVLVSSAHHLPPQHVLTDQQCRPLARPRVKLSAVALDVPHQDRRSITSRSRGPTR